MNIIAFNSECFISNNIYLNKLLFLRKPLDNETLSINSVVFKTRLNNLRNLIK